MSSVQSKSKDTNLNSDEVLMEVGR